MRPAPHRRVRGFSLLELLAVIVVIGVTASALLLSADLGGARARHVDSARAFAVLIERMCEEATLFTRHYGFRLDPPAVRFLRWAGEGWQEREPDRFYRTRSLGEPGFVSLRVAGRDATAAEPDVPQVVCWSSGEMTPFELRLENPAGEHVTLTGSALGEVTVALAREPGDRG